MSIKHEPRHREWSPKIDPVDQMAHLKQTVYFPGLGVNIDV